LKKRGGKGKMFFKLIWWGFLFLMGLWVGYAIWG
jgi:hypothetical protein